MPRDDRERNFENALARNLRANAPAKPQSDTAPAPASHSIPASDCPDAEILAAYHERLLAPEEMTSRKAHLAACLDCQEILAHLEATDEIPLEADQHHVEPKSPIAVPQLVHAARASSSPAARAAIATSDSRPDVPWRPDNRRWLVLSGTLAAALLLWIAIHESTPRPFQMAKNQQQPVPELPAPAPTPPANSAKEKSAEKGLQVPSASKNGPVAKTDALVLDRRALQEKETLRSSPETRLAAPRGIQLGASAGRAGAASRVQAQAPTQDKQLTRDAALAPSASATAGAADSISADQTAVTVAPSAPQQANREAAVRGVVAAPALRQSQTATAGAPAFHEASNSATKLVQVSSPDGAVIWRLGRSGFLQLSEDSGAHWTFQKTSTVSDLLAGSAPSSKICWIAGRDGAILRTLDGGTHWLKVSSPTSEDVATVFAVDNQQATITTPTNQSYKTIDGGNTWTPLKNP